MERNRREKNDGKQEIDNKKILSGFFQTQNSSNCFYFEEVKMESRKKLHQQIVPSKSAHKERELVTRNARNGTHGTHNICF